MKALLLAVQFFPLLLTAVLLYYLPYFSRRGVYFGAIVDAGFPATAQGQSLRHSYRIEVLVWTLLALLLAFIAGSRAPELVPASLTLLVVLTGISYFRRFRIIHRDFGTRVSDIREAALTSTSELNGPTLWITLVPLVLLAAAAVYLKLHWSEIPQRFPVHYGPDGHPNRWAQRSFVGVFQPIFFGLYLNLFLLAIAWLSEHWARRSTMQQLTVRCLQWLTWPLSLVFVLIALSPIFPVPIWLMLLVVFGGVIAIVGWMIRQFSSLPDTDNTAPQPDDCWKAGSFYYAPDDPAIFVEKRVGLGMTFNFGNRWSWVVIAGITFAILFPTALIVIFNR